MAVQDSSVRPDLPSVGLGSPPRSLFRFPPASSPKPLPAPSSSEHTWVQPFDIPPSLYNRLLALQVPITIAILYATTVVLLNRFNKSRGHKPWAISKSRLFRLFVILHNVFLAAYSAWTFFGMAKVVRESWPDNSQKYRLVSVVDALCKVNGPRGLGNAAVYDSQKDTWTMTNPEFHLGEGNAPDPTDVGRLWNKGLAFFGWIFYLSKFYEVLDTVIILAKGKRSSTLQTYHHAGAMMCMWAGIRFMAPPIWIFVLVNSGIHALMYTYYTLTALSFRVPVRIKRTLTTMQIAQFIFGCTIAACHLFIYYSLPVAVPHEVVLGPLASAISEAVSHSNDTGTLRSLAGPWLKKLALRAAGAEGVAENVANSEGSLFGLDGAMASKAVLGKQEIRYSVEQRTFTCMDTSGQAFAIWLNVLYLLPLTYLFVRFFVRSYMERKEPASRHPTHVHVVEKAGKDALKGVTREIRNAIIEMHGEENGGPSPISESPAIGTPHPEAYEANVDDIMTGKQLRAEKKAAEITKNPTGVRLAASCKSGLHTPKDERAYEANLEECMTKKQKSVEHAAARTTTHQHGVQHARSSKQGISTPLDEQAYEANVEDIMTGKQKHVDDVPQDSTASNMHAMGKGTPTPEKRYEASVEEILDEAQKEAEAALQRHSKQKKR